LCRSGYSTSPAVLHLKVDYDPKRATQNVLAKITGSDEQLKNEYVIVGAHYDHMGRDPDGAVYHGANDNASGVATILEIARLWQSQGFRPARSTRRTRPRSTGRGPVRPPQPRERGWFSGKQLSREGGHNRNLEELILEKTEGVPFFIEESVERIKKQVGVVALSAPSLGALIRQWWRHWCTAPSATN
jgi:Zn-dependent M28 family amino/carboxypeptidase